MTSAAEVLARGDDAGLSPARGAGRRRPGTWLAGAFLALAAFACAAPGLLDPGSPSDTDLTAILRPPSWSHPFGTDQLGRDVLRRVVFGARHSLLLGLGATGLALAAALVVGLGAALGGRVVDAVLMRLADILLAFPEMLLALLVISILGPGPSRALLAIGIAATPSYARVTRSRALVVRGSGYVEAARSLGLPGRSVVARHVLPNTVGPLAVLATVGVGSAIVAGSALSFLGLGARPPAPEWGSMMAEGRDFIQRAWWITVFPGAALAATVMAVTVAGRHLRARLDGRGAR